ncbi:HNH endonuclease signature motif containing protein, partial [Promicromonospora sp. NPDC060204]|uniref:HNH endonuclease signature motif containing protein n=1 Tax=Promicromonospora sp. NPDC060204 TaxID=3347071 RepID=UPI003654CEE8
EQGNAPYVHKSQTHGNRKRYELHHVQPRQHGGAVYNPDNLMVVTPKFHSQVLDTKYHFGSRAV